MLEVRRVCETEVPAWTRGDWWSRLLQRTTHRSGWLPHGDHPPLPSVLCCILSHIATYWHTLILVLIDTHLNWYSLAHAYWYLLAHTYWYLLAHIIQIDSTPWWPCSTIFLPHIYILACVFFAYWHISVQRVSYPQGSTSCNSRPYPGEGTLGCYAGMCTHYKSCGRSLRVWAAFSCRGRQAGASVTPPTPWRLISINPPNPRNFNAFGYWKMTVREMWII